MSEAYPYLSKRLLTDKSPRAKAALRSMVYGSENADPSNASPSFSKLLSMGDGFTAYSTATSAVPDADAARMQRGATPVEVKTAPPPSKESPPHAHREANSTIAGDQQEDLIDLLISADGNYVQELLLEEAAKLTDAAMRDTIAQVGNSAAANAIANAMRAPKRLADSTFGQLPLPGPLKSGLNFALLPATILDEISRVLPSLARTQKTDEESLAAFGALWDELNNKREAGSNDRGSLLPSELPSLSTVQESAGPLLQELSDSNSRLRNRLPLLGTLSRRFGALLLRRVAVRLETDAAAPGSPDLARTIAERAAAAERNLADIIEPQQTSEKRSATEGAPAR